MPGGAIRKDLLGRAGRRDACSCPFRKPPPAETPFAIPVAIPIPNSRLPAPFIAALGIDSRERPLVVAGSWGAYD
jgi:hypothetical protein